MTSKGETMYLSSSMFNDVADAASNCGVVTDTTWVQINGNMYQKRIVSLYANEEYADALGACTIYYDQCEHAVGMKDTYDFDKGNRSLPAEVATSIGSLLPGSAYQIRYGVYD